MFEDMKLMMFFEFVQIFGFFYGIDVWFGNVQELIYNNMCELSEVIGCCDDIMVYLIYQGFEFLLVFKIMEFVCKGKGLMLEWEEEMKKNNVLNWYIDLCKKIKYMFLKVYVVVYVLMVVWIVYFKVYYVFLYYAVYFIVCVDDFDIDMMIKGLIVIRVVMDDISFKGFDVLLKEKNFFIVLEFVFEMCECGYFFQKVDLYCLSVLEFIIDGNSLILLFNLILGFGINVVFNIVKVWEEGEFFLKEDF